jgi:cold shock CspA family protein
MRSNGGIKSWNDERGFGFIELRPGGPEILSVAACLS